MSKHHDYLPYKRLADVLVSLVLTVITAPLLLLSMAAVALTSSGPVVYSQTRVGRGRRLFTIFKIRSMYHDCERLSGPRWSTENDPRVTPVGHFLRKSHLDELPQLWNVLRGDMSLIGPRPERPEFIGPLEKVIPRYAERLAVRPGVTGLAQVNLPPDTDRESVRIKLVQDLDYIDRLGPWLDFRIMAATGLFLLGVPFATSSRFFGLYQKTPARCADLTVLGYNSGSALPKMELERVPQALSAWPES